MKRNAKYVFGFLTIIIIVVLATMDPIPQDTAYHNFADQRSFFGIPNFWDVMSNLPMFFIGLYGFWRFSKRMSQRPDFVAKSLPYVLCFGIFLASFGSAYYHWAPDNQTLVWDRLPMTLMFMPLFSLLIYDFIGRKEGRIAYYVTIPLGIFSVLYWQYTESIGQGDLRLYAFVQFFPMLAVPLVIWLFPKKVPYIKDILLLLAWYIVAKLAEYFDVTIFEILGFWSGHTIKHLVASIALVYAIRFLNSWEKELLRE